MSTSQPKPSLNRSRHQPQKSSENNPPPTPPVSAFPSPRPSPTPTKSNINQSTPPSSEASSAYSRQTSISSSRFTQSPSSGSPFRPLPASNTQNRSGLQSPFKIESKPPQTAPEENKSAQTKRPPTWYQRSLLGTGLPKDWKEFDKGNTKHLMEFARPKLVQLFHMNYPIPIIYLLNQKTKEPIFLVQDGAGLFQWRPWKSNLRLYVEPYTIVGLKCIMNLGLPSPRFKEMQPLPEEKVLRPGPEDSIKPNEIPDDWTADPDDLECHHEGFSLREYRLCERIPLLTEIGTKSGDANHIFKCHNRYYVFNEISSKVYHIADAQSRSQICSYVKRDSLSRLNLKLMRPPLEYGGPYEIPDDDVPEGWSKDVGDTYMTEGKPWRDVLDIRPKPILVQRSQIEGNTYLIKGNAQYLWNPKLDRIARINEPRGLQWTLNVLKEDGGNLRKLNVTLVGKPSNKR